MPEASTHQELTWHTSSFSGGAENCVEVARDGAGWWLRDSKDRTGPAHHFTPAQWKDFLLGVKNGELG
ncbi:DUF397 domain-containing protein [Actinopolyspora mortivallis]|uniref:DUF397 domain-containing protein n=1 Tax=Actinopolyspora mortivallis TaxID=33906 RepID=UPI0003693BA5|nr:DUF397 domain-containing protein [Actinopolyspora mortivallis]